MTPEQEMEARRRALSALATPPVEEVAVQPVGGGVPLAPLSFEALSAPVSPEVRAWAEGRASRPKVDAELDAALEEAREKRTRAGYWRAANMFAQGATGNSPYDAHIKALEGSADEPVRELEARRAEVAKRAEAERKAALSDPNSSVSIRLRALLGATGAEFDPDTIGGITAENAPQAFQAAGMQLAGARHRDALEAKSRELKAKKEAEEKGKEDKLARDERDRVHKLEGEVRRELMGNPVVKSYQEAAIAYDKVQRAAAEPSAANDLALIFATMKTLDPGSTVREGEFATAQNATGVPERILNLYNRAMRGERLSPEQRTDFVRTARGQFQAAKSRADDIIGSYGGLARSLGLTLDHVVLPGGARVDIDLSAPTSAAQQAKPPQQRPERRPALRGGAPSPKPATAGKVQMRWPDGRLVAVPADKVEEAKSRYRATEVR